ncbi:BEM_collapsed_G0019010.mRNA.1.CDS.1 [Saccharomyces cerevisiae]|nr:BEM_collapsed_G0019010.mRNA.1.CDS.1 [Saccharomyces cerevisiae]
MNKRRKRVRRKARHTILVDPNNRQHDSPNKTVSWADDLESGLGAEDDLEQDEQLEGGAPISSTSNKAGSKLKTKKKKKWLGTWLAMSVLIRISVSLPSSEGVQSGI